MALKPINAGLRRFVNDSVSIAKVDLRVAPGAEIAVNDETAAQLPPAFKDPDVVAARDAARVSVIEPVAKRSKAKKADDEAAPEA